MITHRFMVMLDVLIDTRYGTLKRFWPETHLEALKDNYHERRWDDWSQVGISQKDFMEKYALRDKETLKHSSISFLAPMLNDAANEVEEASTRIAIVPPMSVEINTYPYNDLNKDECKQIAKSLTIILGRRVQVTTTHVPYEQMTLKYIKQRYGVLMIYDLNEWLLTQKESLSEESMPSVQVVAPAIFNGVYDEERVDAVKEEPFIDAEVNMAQHFRLCLQPVKYFSFLMPPK